ncbi:16S rRNA (cytosine(967)-C(5))-methyltransferase RsmB [Ottowia sp. GY511]|uniref:16S rRNA (cytosine(967)-C(5))-methyltransferase n=1 Tax=Ottowia flava TaxID=2675430 RepID=A0ABW4KQS4_9BURK|nr:16S rRNA (cytosine(967)-C(5))-methyltransferase RsmB [Ottowia sp. GY511]TXK31064.1 16S rRNA (cytosine(967)-C(5))-methyltransferase RsmB [Ottowia sp. GY511]
MEKTPDVPQASPHSPALWRQLQWTAKLVQDVQDVQAGRSLATTIDQVPGELRSGVQALTFHTLRHLGAAAALRDQLVARRPSAAVDALLLTALALMLPAPGVRHPPHTLVDQAVEAAKKDKATRHQAGLLNAVLRRLGRERERLFLAVRDDLGARWNHPKWWIERVQADHPAAWQAILEQAQQPAPMVLRVNTLRSSTDAVLTTLDQHGIEAVRLDGNGIALARPMPVAAIPGFAEGMLSVQSAAAQMAAPLLMSGLSVDSPRVLDACAAPGGKTAHILELSPSAQVTALEVDARRAERIGSTLSRLGLQADIRVADAGLVSDWWDGIPFDRIMLDAPCSASGIVRRHPDIRWLRRATDIHQLANQQDRLLAAMWPVLAVGGRLLYATCSVFHEEGIDRIQAFLSRHMDAGWLPSPGHLIPSGAGAGLSSGENAACDDGFFYALLEKRAA